MANALYRKTPDNYWINQGNGGGPALMFIQLANDGSGQWTFILQYTGDLSYQHSSRATQAVAQTNLDNYAAQLNAGTA